MAEENEPQQWAVIETATGWHGKVVQVVKMTAASLVYRGRRYGEDGYEDKPTRCAKHNVLLVTGSKAAADTLSASLSEIWRRKTQVERSLAEERRALIAAARGEKGIDNG